MIHAIGDKSIFELLYIFEAVGLENGDKDRRFRIEHAQHIDSMDIPRFAGLGVIPSMQPYHLIDDGRWAQKYIGAERAKTSYAFQDLLTSGAKVVFGSDWFVAPPTPLEGIYAAVTRRTLDDKNPKGWVPAQKISLNAALKAYTKDAAYASFEERIKGTLEVGKLADFVLLGGDLTQMAPENLRNVPILMTVVGGRVVYQLPKPVQ
jgi:predicted amidohydrolase YtcJ